MAKDKQSEPQQGSEQDKLSAEQPHESAQTEPDPSMDKAGTEEDSGDDLGAQLDKAKLLIAEQAEQLLRARAETENMRKRHAKEIEQARAYAMESFVIEVLTVKDSLETGLENMNEADDKGAQQDAQQDLGKIQEGVELTLQVLQKVFEKFGISELNPQGEEFDPEHHQAMMTEASAEHKPGTVLKVIQKGYLLKGRLVRPALVSVAGDDAPAKETN